MKKRKKEKNIDVKNKILKRTNLSSWKKFYNYLNLYQSRNSDNCICKWSIQENRGNLQNITKHYKRRYRTLGKHNGHHITFVNLVEHI